MDFNSRPLSPHLQVYKPQLTSVLSIGHRFTGALLSLGALWLAYWFVSAAVAPGAFAFAQSVMGAWYGQVILCFWTFILFYHLCNGIRHLVWDTGHWFALRSIYLSGYGVVAFAFVLTAIVWIFALVW